MKRFLQIAVLIFGLLSSSYAQTGKTTSVEEGLRKHILFLADDKLEGRRAGTPGEEKAMNYIAQQFKLSGLEPRGNNGYFQPFEIKEGRKMGADAKLSLNKRQLKADDEYFFLPFSANKKYKGTGYFTNQTQAGPWFIDLDKAFDQDAQSPHFDINTSLYNLTTNAAAKGATALFLYHSSSATPELGFNKRDQSAPASIPVVYLKNKTAQILLASKAQKQKIKLTSSIIEGVRTGHNVVGYINNQAAYTVVLGAHFDHLGYGEDGNSMLRTGEKLIHNGADDNASGTAALLELAGAIKKSDAKNNNYLFIGFSGEELGLFGSKFYVEHPTIDLDKVNYMINLDMVGRLNDSTKTLTIGGVGTSPSWAGVGVINPMQAKNFNIKVDSSGAGPSDHTSFYRKGIPVLFYFTGLHHDYHRPTDDFDKINFKGETLIVKNVEEVIKALDASPKLAFLKTRELQVSTTSFKVTLGIMPDYTFSGQGVKADGITEGRPAALAGMKAGDIVLGLGEYPINGMDAYMKALNKFKKGDKTTLKYKRGNDIIETPVEFK